MAKKTGKGNGARRFLKICKWCGISIAGVLAIIVLGFLTVFYTPFFPAARTQYILMTLHTSNPWLATAFFSQETIDQVVQENRVESPDEDTDVHLVQTAAPHTTTAVVDVQATEVPTIAATTTTTTKPTAPRTTQGGCHVSTIYETDGMDILQFTEKKYVARLIRVKDPSRVQLELCQNFMVKGKYGEKLLNICNRVGAVAGINAGGFQDAGGRGSGNFPTMLCVKDYKILYSDDAIKTHNVVGFNKDNILVLGKFTNQQIIDNHIRDAVEFKPFLIVNGVRSTFYGAAGGADPRAAIGQTADGTVLLLTIDGRQIGMEGGSMKTLTDIMWEYGAITAANLDGGSSTTMVLNGKVINKTCGPAGPRYLPNAWVIR